MPEQLGAFIGRMIAAILTYQNGLVVRLFIQQFKATYYEHKEEKELVEKLRSKINSI
jgi:hypothetical protein